MRSALLALFLIGCGGTDPFTAVTYNAGLAEGFVLGASERAETTAAATVALDADVICVQEVWLPEHIAAFEAAAATDYPHTVFMADAPDGGSEAACANDDLDPLFTCYADNCADGCFDKVADCLLQNCGGDFLALGDQCIGCLEANVGDAPNARENCETEDTKYAYGGAFGIGILSAHPITSSETITLDSTTNRRGTIHAVLDVDGDPVDVFCTHLTADLALPYTGAAEGWAPEQLAQINTLTDWVGTQATADLSIWMGDFNTGPDGTEYDAELLENYTALASIGWDAPYPDEDIDCTYCLDNGLINNSGTGAVLDHVFVNSPEGTVYTATRVLDADIDVPACGETISAPPSDHYGVQVIITQ